MKRFLSVMKALRSLHPLSKTAILIGATWMSGMYILAAAAYRLAPFVDDYLYALSVHRGALEAAPACLAVGVCAGLIGDLMLRPHRPDQDFFHRQ